MAGGTHLTGGTQDIWLEERILPEERSIAKHDKHLTRGTQRIWPEERILPDERKTFERHYSPDIVETSINSMLLKFFHGLGSFEHD